MNSEELIGWLNVISSLLNREEYEQAIDYIEKKEKGNYGKRGSSR